MLGVAKFIELKAKTDRGKEIKALTFGSMVHQFLDKEKRRISSIPQEGITMDISIEVLPNLRREILMVQWQSDTRYR